VEFHTTYTFPGNLYEVYRGPPGTGGAGTNHWQSTGNWAKQ
jgi:hypothetical protein